MLFSPCCVMRKNAIASVTQKLINYFTIIIICGIFLLNKGEIL